MIEGITSFFVEQITGLVGVVGYPAIFLLMTLESALIPIPSEITMPFAGFLVGFGKLDFWLVVLVAAFANLAGSLAAYWLGSWGREYVHHWTRRYGKFLLITLEDIQRAERWFRSHGELVAFGSRLLPIVRTFISLPAGMSKMNVFRFSVYTFLGSLIWSAFLAYIGFVLGKNWHSIEIYFRKFQFLVIAVILALSVWYILYKIEKIKNVQSNTKN